MASYAPSNSFYPCPWRASDIFKPQPAPPPTYFLKDHTRVVYNDADWPTIPEDEGMSEEQDKHVCDATMDAGTKSVIISAQPLSLLSVKMREYSEKGGSGGSRTGHGNVLKEGQFASPGRYSVHFFEFYSSS